MACLTRAAITAAVVLGETRPTTTGHTQHIVQNQNLTIAIDACANADRGNLHALSNLLGQCRGNALQHNGESAGAFGRFGVFDQRLFVTLHPISAELMHALRPQTHVRHHGNSSADQRRDNLGLFHTALQLDRRAAGFGHYTGSGLERIDGRGLI